MIDVIDVMEIDVGYVLMIVYLKIREVLGKICGGGRHKDDDKGSRRKKRE
jgi:hypothetical protein